MELHFNNFRLELLYKGEQPKGKPQYQQQTIEKFIKIVGLMKNAENAEDLLKLKSLNFEKLTGNKKHLHSIRVNDQYRLEFELNNSILKLADVANIEDLSNHYK